MIGNHNNTINNNNDTKNNTNTTTPHKQGKGVQQGSRSKQQHLFRIDPLPRTLLYYTILYDTIRYYTILYYTVLYYTVP